MICDSFYEALAMQAAAAEAAIPEMPEHRFSLRYKQKKKALIKAYEKSKEQSSSFLSTFHKLRLHQKIFLQERIPHRSHISGRSFSARFHP